MEQLQFFCFPNESNENEHSISLFVGPLLGSTGAVTILYLLPLSFFPSALASQPGAAWLQIIIFFFKFENCLFPMVWCFLATILAEIRFVKQRRYSSGFFPIIHGNSFCSNAWTNLKSNFSKMSVILSNFVWLACL